MLHPNHPLTTLSQHIFTPTSPSSKDTITAHYMTNPGRTKVSLHLYPTSLSPQLIPNRTTIANESWTRNNASAAKKPAIVVEPLVHVKLVGDDQPGQFGPGRTTLWATSNEGFELERQDREGEEGAVVTVLKDSERGLRIEHRLSSGEGGGMVLKSETRFINGSEKVVKLELLTSFAISGITPFAGDDAPGRLTVHRFRAAWSAEGRMVSDSIEGLHLERAYAGGIKLSERFGQVGSMPVRGWFPTALVEDTKMGVVWGARLACPTSWQMEVARRYDDVILAGGYADREFGHWVKSVGPGETFEAAPAWVTCVQGTVDDACEALLSVDVPAVEAQPAVEHDLPVGYNDWGTSWGAPREDRILEVADRLVALGVQYLVIDAGWYMPESENAHWATTMGDWKANPTRFPRGLAGTAAAIRDKGLIPGLWMEPEHVARDSLAFQELDHLLHRDGQPLTLELRRAWDLHDPWVHKYIDERVIGLLAEAGFGYLKIDYSETLGIGVDNQDSLGEGLRRHGEGTHALFSRIKAALPDLVTELVSAGGSRMEASLLQRSSMASSTDAHETLEIPIISAALHRLVLPRQSLIWAVLNHDDSINRLEYTLAATFLGRMCLSGNIMGLGVEQLAFVKKAVDLYKQAVPVIRDGVSRCHTDQLGPSWRHPTGWQGLVRATNTQIVVVLHCFEHPPEHVRLALPSTNDDNSNWQVVNTLTAVPVSILGSLLEFSIDSDFEAQVVLLELL